jgi:LacI family transcriptional regulator
MPDSKTDRPSTIYDVAAAAGVSIKSVSRVLRGESKVSAETRERVREAVRELGYAPHPSARNLASSVPSVIGLVTSSSVDFLAARVGSEYRMALQTGALAAALPHGFALRLVPVDLGSATVADELVAQVRTGAVGGYLLAPPAAEMRQLLDRLAKAGVLFAVVNTSNAPEGCTAVTAAERDAVRLMVTRILDLGHRRIAFVAGREGSYATEQRLAGYKDALAMHGQPFDPGLLAPVGMSAFEEGKAAAVRLLSLANRPTAIVASTDDCAAGVMAAAHERGLTIPDDLSVTGFDDLALAQKVWPPLTTVRHPIERIVELATRRLITLLQPRRRDIPPLPARIELPCELVMRGSLGPPAARRPR